LVASKRLNLHIHQVARERSHAHIARILLGLILDGKIL
jgi:hypothetical protein